MTRARTPRGFLDFGEGPDKYGRAWRLLESSIAGEGAHVRLLLANDDLHLSVSQAEDLRDALSAFLRAARAGECTEDP